MTHTLLINNFLPLDTVFEVLGALIAFFIGFYSHKIYLLTSQKRYIYFTWAFYFIFFSFLLAAFSNYVNLGESASATSLWVKTTNIETITDLFILAQAIFFTLGMITIAIVSFDMCEKSMTYLFYLLAISAVVFSANFFFMFHFISAIIILFILPKFYGNYLKKKSGNTLHVFIAFALFFLANLLFVTFWLGNFYAPLLSAAVFKSITPFTIASITDDFYFLAQAVQLTGFIVLLAGLVRIFRK